MLLHVLLIPTDRAERLDRQHRLSVRPPDGHRALPRHLRDRRLRLLRAADALLVQGLDLPAQRQGK
jgi:hypothetical protein